MSFWYCLILIILHPAGVPAGHPASTPFPVRDVYQPMVIFNCRRWWILIVVLQEGHIARFSIPGETLISLTPLHPSVPFDTGLAGAGYFSGGLRVDNRFNQGVMVFAQVRAWTVQTGETYDEAVNSGLGGHGASNPFAIILGGGAGHVPATLEGLESFRLLPIVPEPGTVGLLAVGAFILIASRFRRGITARLGRAVHGGRRFKGVRDHMACSRFSKIKC